MKKILSCLLVVMLIFSLSAAAFADNFVNSVANAGAPEIAAATDADGNDTAAAIVITPNDEADTLEEAQQTELKSAFDSLSNAADLKELNNELKEAAGDRNIAISDLFEVTAKEEVKFPLTLTLVNKNLANFVGVIHFVDGQWVWVDSEVDGENVKVTVDSLGAFAIVVAVEEAASAQTGETVPYGFIIGAVVLAGAAAWFFAKSRKVEA